ncbi:glutamate--tRNA ligase [Helicobacter cholecystus]|uniref:Glutamate--tRNA ligase n=1 Tax=Helicobacter cholecystus TaxID=45498 RepID=A0A3D8IZ65_9HELI|nr:glutamate--tRNA ligase [Helicobacter cholecystus]RDU69851.1 glutamate--tRNA ligase [Helicobacter cholecystus]VEJ25796.1 glutamyl-tRNA synthetase [Helicobacter cholecystus]
MSVVTRFAPSPTGYLHIGGLRTALFNYLYAKKEGGKFLLRIEDTDLQRNSQEAANAIIKAFQWCEMHHDGEVIYQSQRFPLYKEYIQKLLDEDKAYYCYMTKEELDALREEQRANKLPPRYDNRYRDFKGIPPKGVQPVVRIKAPLEGSIIFEDGVKGRIEIAAKEIDDFIIARSDGSPTYNFVVAIDDALMGVTDIIRGDDHTTNTSKQIVVYEALGFKVPKFFHVPMILNPDGKKLSKRDGATDVMEYKTMGYLHEALLNFLVRLGWSSGDKEIFSMEEMITLFSPNHLNSSASCYNQSKLDWLNNHYIREMDNSKLKAMLKDFGSEVNLEGEKLEVLFQALKERNYTLVSFAKGVEEVLNAPEKYDEKMYTKLSQNSKENLSKFIATLSEGLSVSEYEAKSKEFMSKHSLKPADFLQPLRLAILGKGGGIGMAECIFVLGVKECAKRIETLITK